MLPKQDKTTTRPTIQVRFTPKMKLNCHDRSEWVWYVTKTRKNNNVTDCIGVVYIENKTELS